MKLLLNLGILITALVLIPLAEAQYDLNNNGTLDLALTVFEEDQVRWFGQDLTTGEVVDLGIFGHPSYQLSLGHWDSRDVINRVYVRKTGFGEFQLQSDADDTTYPLGVSDENGSVILGRDIDSSGLLDAVLVNGQRRKWAWKVSLDPLTGKGEKRRVLFGLKRYIPFLFRARGASDSLAFLQVRGRRSKIVYRSLKGRRKRTIRIRGVSIPNTRPLVIRGKNGRDSFAFAEDQKLFIVNSRGKGESRQIQVPEKSNIIVADFKGDGQETLAYLTSGDLILSDGQLVQLAPQNARPLGVSEVQDYLASEVSPDIVPTHTYTATPVITAVPTSSPSLTPSPTKTPTVSPTYTPLPTWTALPTSTPAPTQTPLATYTFPPTFTALPTQTPQPTYTAYPTFTPTATLTITPTATPTDTPTLVPTPVITGTPPTSSIVRADCKAHLTAGEISDGMYWIDPDGSGTGVGPFRAYCDMTTDGGGWTLILNYLHQGGTNPSLNYRGESLPLLGGTDYLVDESNTDFWGHATTILLSKMDVTEMRFYCEDEPSSEVWHFKSTLSNCISYMQTGLGNCSDIENNSTVLSGNTIALLELGDTLRSNQGFDALTFEMVDDNWRMRQGGDEWVCFANQYSDSRNTHHQIWVR